MLSCTAERTDSHTAEMMDIHVLELSWVWNALSDDFLKSTDENLPLQQENILFPVVIKEIF